MKSAGKARNNGLYRHIRTSKEIIRNLLNDFIKNSYKSSRHREIPKETAIGRAVSLLVPSVRLKIGNVYSAPQLSGLSQNWNSFADFIEASLKT